MSNEPIWRRYRDLLRRRPTDDGDEEIRHHLQMREQEALRAGLDPDRAQAAARERFGDVDGVVAELHAIDRSRERRRSRIEWLSDLRQDTRFALRSLRRSPSFAATAILTTAVAIAANTAIFSFVNTLLLEPLPYQRPQELVTVDANVVGSIGELLALQQRRTGFADVAMIRPRSITYSDDREAARLDGYAVMPNLFSVLGVAPEIGRVFDAGTTRPGAGNAIVLSHSLWMERYGGDARIVGRYVSVDGVQSLVVAVMPASFVFPSAGAKFWTPLSIDVTKVGATWAVGNSLWIARLGPGVTVERATAALASILPAFRRLNPLWDPGADYAKRAIARPLQQSLIGSERPALILLSACVVVVLLVACVNLANLMLARVTAREREFTVRAALGGGRWRLVRQLLTESVIIALTGATIGLVLAAAGVRWANAAMPPGVARTGEIRFDSAVFGFTAVLAIATGVAFGLLPALRATVAAGTTDAARLTRTGGATNHRLVSTLVGGEVALAVLLAITAGLLTRSFARLSDLSTGFRSEHVVTAQITPPAASYADPNRTSAFYAALVERIASTPGVTSVGVVDHLPIAAPVYGVALRVEGQFEDAARGLPTADHWQAVTSGYFSSLGIPILRGRGFTDQDRGDALPVAVVSQALARHFWPGGDAIGKRIGFPWLPSPWITIVGVVPNVRLDSLRDTSSMAVYVPFEQRARFALAEMSIVIRTTTDPSAIGRQLRDAVGSIDRSVPVSAVRAMDDVISRSVAKPRFMTLIVGGFALITLLLGAIGIYGVMSYVVSQRAHEMGVRVALGATSAELARLVLSRATVVAGVGAVAGCLLALIATRGFRSLLYGVSATDPTTFALAPLALLATAILASLLPARRAMRADPVEVLRQS